MILYSVTLYLVFFAAGFPAGMISLIWTPISEKMAVAVPYVSLLRAMIAAGGVTACIVCGRNGQKREKSLDLSLAGVSLETLGVIGLSLSRVFWHLLLWSFVLGLGFGAAMTRLTVTVVRSGTRSVMLNVSGAFMGAFAGTWLLSETMAASGSWRTGCQVLGIVQILIAVTAFLIRRLLMKGGDFRRALDERSRSIDLERERQRRALHADRNDIRDAETRYLRQAAFSCAAAFLTGILVFAIAMWPQSFRVAETGAGEEMTAYGILLVSLGMAAGCLAAGLLQPGRRTVQILSVLLLAGFLSLEQYLIYRNGLTDSGLLVFQFLTGAAAGPVFPSLLLLDDVRLDRDAETSLIVLLPAFAIGSVIVGTPLTQALVGGGQAAYFPLWLLLITAAAGTCLFLPEFIRPGRGKKA